jgi:hypothetical protein
MDLRRLRVGEWIFGVSGALLLISLFLPWWGLEGPWGKLGPAGPTEAGYFDNATEMTVTTFTAWQVFSVADILFALLGLLALLVFVIVSRWEAPGPGLAGEALLTLLAIPMTIVAIVQVVGTPGVLELPPPLPDPSIEIGAWLGLASSFGVLLGLLAAMRDERLSEPGEPTDQAGVPVAEPVAVETLPLPPPA